MFIVRILFNVKADMASEFKPVAQECVTLAKKHSGCILYDIYTAQTDSNKYLLYEEWEMEENFKAYKTSPTFKEIGDKLTPFLDGAPSTTYFSAQITEQH